MSRCERNEPGDDDGDQRLTVAEFCTAYDKMMANSEQLGAVIMGVVKTIVALRIAIKT